MQTVLLVDDEPDILSSLGDLLEGSIDGVRVVPAPGGAQALAQLRAGPVDLIVTDYRMPDMDGLDFLLEATNLAPATPRIMITAFPDLEIALRAINEAGVETFLTKPLDANRLVESVRGILQRADAAGDRSRTSGP